MFFVCLFVCLFVFSKIRQNLLSSSKKRLCEDLVCALKICFFFFLEGAILVIANFGSYSEK